MEESSKRHKTIYNPGVAMTFFVKNAKTGEKVKATTLSLRDEEQRPWRSPKGTIEGYQFFKMKIGTREEGYTYLKFMNSVLNAACASETGDWIFEGERADGSYIPKTEDICRNKLELKLKENAKKKELTNLNQVDYNIRDYTSAIYYELIEA